MAARERPGKQMASALTRAEAIYRLFAAKGPAS